jgi:hypothetical protein
MVDLVADQSEDFQLLVLELQDKELLEEVMIKVTTLLAVAVVLLMLA